VAQGAADTKANATPEPEVAQTALFLKIAPEKRPWGILFDGNGSLYVAGNNFEIDRISPSREVTHLANINPEFVGPGMAFDANRDLLIADGQHVLRINRFGLTTPLISGFTRALDMHVDRYGNILVGDDIEGKVYCITPKLERKVLIDRQLTPMWFALTSIALDAKGENLYVAESVTGRIIKYAMPADGVAGQPEVIAEGIVGLRFLTLDQEGNVYANTHFPILIRIDKDKKQRRFFMDNLEDPAGMAFGGKGYDPNSLYITNRYGITQVNTQGQGR
jgi:sugar lactone lactonase YvrE